MLIDYAAELNEAQYRAATTTEGPILVIAGAGSGKTRTIVYRLAYLVEQGVPPETILLLTFTRKASGEMLHRAGELLGQHLHTVSGGTFHSFAYSILRRYGDLLGFPGGFTVMDQGDAEDTVKQAKGDLGIGKQDKKFPRVRTILGLFSKSRNKEIDLETVLRQEAYHMQAYGDDLENLFERYCELKQEYGLMDYDDLLFMLEKLLLEHEDLRSQMQDLYQYIMVDEYQDTNRVQARIVRLLAGERANIMAVGDDAQSIYAFRGADVRNILEFPDTYPDTKVIKLEQNYRSSQPILRLTNQILAQARERFAKDLFTEREGDDLPQLIRPLSDKSQARIVLTKILELAQTSPLHEIAVLFRAGYQSYHLEVELNKMGLKFQKFGGLKFSEAAHIKDMLSYMRLVHNPADLPAWRRALSPISGIGPKTAEKIYQASVGGNDTYIASLCAKKPSLGSLLTVLDTIRSGRYSPAASLTALMEYYTPILENRYPDDYPRRVAGLEELSQIANSYTDIDAFLGDLSLDNPENLGGGREIAEDHLVLSTVHSAKGLEWKAVLVIDLVEDRFPSKHAQNSGDDFEEERRLLYVACTRARDYLGLFQPETLYNRFQERSDPTRPCPFLLEVDQGNYQEWRENYAGGVSQKPAGRPRPDLHMNAADSGSGPAPARSSGPAAYGFCRHKIFGRGKIVAEVPPDKYKVNFPSFGLKVIIAEYLELE